MAWLFNMKYVFFGTDDYSAAVLEKLISDFYYPALVVSQPDRPVGRHQTLTPPAVKHICLTHRLPIVQPQRAAEAEETIRAVQPDVFIVASFGQIIPASLLAIPKHGAINVHTSLLPRHRGASPIQAALLAGDESTGVTIMLMDAQLDHGPILHQERIAIAPTDTNITLRAKLATVGADTLCKILPDYLHGKLSPRPQNHAVATTAGMIDKAYARLDWNKPCAEADRRVRAFQEWPWAWTNLPSGKRMQIMSAQPQPSPQPMRQAPGTLLIENEQARIACTDGWLLLREVQVEGKNACNGEAFSRGYRSLSGQSCV